MEKVGPPVYIASPAAPHTYAHVDMLWTHGFLLTNTRRRNNVPGPAGGSIYPTD